MKLHKEHGLNPTMCVCVFCGKDNGSIALLGGYIAGKAQGRTVVDFNGCNDCIERLKTYYALLPSEDGVNLTGKGCIWVKKERWSEIFNQPPPMNGYAFIEQKIFDRIGEGAVS